MPYTTITRPVEQTKAQIAERASSYRDRNIPTVSISSNKGAFRFNARAAHMFPTAHFAEVVTNGRGGWGFRMLEEATENSYPILRNAKRKEAYFSQTTISALHTVNTLDLPWGTSWQLVEKDGIFLAKPLED